MFSSPNKKLFPAQTTHPKKWHQVQLGFDPWKAVKLEQRPFSTHNSHISHSPGKGQDTNMWIMTTKFCCHYLAIMSNKCEPQNRNKQKDPTNRKFRWCSCAVLNKSHEFWESWELLSTWNQWPKTISLSSNGISWYHNWTKSPKTVGRS